MISATYTLPALDGRAAYALANRLDKLLPPTADYQIGLNRAGTMILRTVGVTVLLDDLAEIVSAARREASAA